jgi:error-prone DNA polymerase
LAPGRRQALWKVLEGVDSAGLFEETTGGGAVFPAMNLAEELQEDYEGMELSIARHGMELLRPELPGVMRAADLPEQPHGRRVAVAGAVICRQRPGTARGFVFVSLEDETGIVNIIVEPKFFEKHRLVITQEPFLLIKGPLQKVDGVIHVRARHVEGLQAGDMITAESHDFR